MTKTPLPFQADDISSLARAINRQLARIDHKPGHLEMLNMLARAGGFRNFQHFHASRRTDDEPLRINPVPPSSGSSSSDIDQVAIRRLSFLFDDAGRLISWPSGLKRQELCLWVLWSKMPARLALSEREVSRRLDLVHLFGDAALLRRSLCNGRLMTRRPDGSDYRRIEQRPPADALALIGLLGRPAASAEPGRLQTAG